MDFFAHQDHARQQTRRLIFLFGITVLALSLAISVVLLLVLPQWKGFFGPVPVRPGATVNQLDFENLAWLLSHRPEALLVPALLIAGFIVAVSLFKIWRLSQTGGPGVAERLGGTRLNPGAGLHERMLQNVVEEMAIASGSVVPQIYVLKGEHSINALAAGLGSADATIAVTEGCLLNLDREELQAVIAHEFSHIVHGDMRLNLRMIGVLHGIFALALLGESLMKTRGGSSGRGRTILIGLALFVMGYLGYFCGSLIRAALSRQREFLADSSSAQYTRNPLGLARALRKIAGWRQAVLSREGAGEVCHMLFADGVRRKWSALFSTHPPVSERISRLEGRRAAVNMSEAAGPVSTEPQTGPFLWPPPGEITAAGLARASELRTAVSEESSGQLPEAGLPLRVALWQALVPVGETWTPAQLHILQQAGVTPQQCSAFAAQPRQETFEQKMTLIDIGLARLARAHLSERKGFLRTARDLILADKNITLSEFALYKTMLRHLMPHSVRKSSSGMNFFQAAAIVLAGLSDAGAGDATVKKRRFLMSMQRLINTSDEVRMPPLQLSELDGALARLNGGTPQQKKRFFHACMVCVKEDGQILVEEAQLLRGICAAIDIPVPLLTGTV